MNLGIPSLPCVSPNAAAPESGAAPTGRLGGFSLASGVAMAALVRLTVPGNNCLNRPDPVAPGLAAHVLASGRGDDRITAPIFQLLDNEFHEHPAQAGITRILPGTGWRQG